MEKFVVGAAIGLLVGLAAGANAGGYTAGGGTITGIVRFAGTPPRPRALEVTKDRDVCAMHPLFDQSLIVGKHGGIANAVVTIPNAAAGVPLKPAAVRFDQKGCEYRPHVAVFPAGSTVEITNSDAILHNIHTESQANPVIDIAQPGFKKTISVTVEKAEAIRVSCDAHNWMEGWWYVTATPYYAVTDEKGRYTIGHVPPGTYRLNVWQEKLGTASREVTVKPGAITTAVFALGAKTR